MAEPHAATEDGRHEVRLFVLTAAASGSLDDFTSTSRTLDDERFPFPAAVFTEMAADALALAGVTRSAPMSLDDFAERYRPE